MSMLREVKYLWHDECMMQGIITLLSLTDEDSDDASVEQSNFILKWW
jgi:hypothetical protein